MNYGLAKKLRDAGFPQNQGNRWSFCSRKGRVTRVLVVPCPQCKRVFNLTPHQYKRRFCTLSCRILYTATHCSTCNKAKTKSRTQECTECNTKRAREYRRTISGRIAVGRSVKKSIALYPHKQRARVLLNQALKRGVVIKPLVCFECAGQKKLDAHHKDYSKPYEVTWYCRRCHTRLHLLTRRNMLK